MKSSFLLKVKAAEIVSSGFVTFSGLGLSMVLTRFFFQDQYHLGFTMRFPRAVAIRDDLTIADCMTASGMSVRVWVCDKLNETWKLMYSCLGEFEDGKETEDG